MEPEKDHEENFSRQPDIADERFWRQFDGELWRVLKEEKESAEKEKIENEPVADRTATAAAHLTFPRLHELAQAARTMTAAETAHLDDCRYCERRRQKFRELAAPTAPTAVIQNRNPSLRTKIKEFFRTKSVNFLPSPVLAAAFGGILILSGLTFWAFFKSPPVVEQSQIEKSNPGGEPSKTIVQPNETNVSADANQNAADSNQKISNDSPPGNLTPHRKSSAPENETADELDGVPAAEREAVVAALRAAPVPPSETLRLFRAAPVVRGAARTGEPNRPPRQINPVNRVIDETAPVLRWENVGSAEYTVIITDRARREVVKSGALKQNNWRVSAALSPGWYFWTVTARKADGTESVSAARPALFKIIDRTEKQTLENENRRVKNNLAKAVIYFRGGLFDEAERELAAELKRNPDSRRARSLLRQIREFTDKSANP